MDFSIKDVYKKDKFVLRSVTRNKDFPFIRFNGNNFEELKSFITSYSSNTVIDEPGLLKEGELYTYSGRYFTLKRIPIDQLRYVIASNPYLVTENGDCIPLTLDHQQAEAYLKENRHHKLFTYNNILATYKYSPEYSSFVMYDRSHPKGMSINGLLHGYEWYIGGDDGTNRLWKLIAIEKDDTLHTIDIRPSFSFSVQRIGDLIHNINNKLVLQRRALLFNESWDNLERRKILKARCHNKASFKRFVNALFHTLFRERDNESSSTTTSFGTFANEPFIQSIETLHDYYEYGKDSFQTSVGQVFQQYLEHNQGPQDIDDYEKLQVSLLNDCYFFLKKVYDSILDEIRIEGTIGQDDQGHLYCGKALLSQNLYIYRGCKCVITSLVKNPDEKTVGKFPFYSNKLNIVTLNRMGIISKDEEGTFFVDKYVLKGSVAKQLGEEVQLRLIRPFVKPRGEYLGEVIDYALPDTVSGSSPSQGKDPKRLGHIVKLHWPSDAEFLRENTTNVPSAFYNASKFGAASALRMSIIYKLFCFLVTQGKLSNTQDDLMLFTFRLTGKNPDAIDTDRKIVWLGPRSDYSLCYFVWYLFSKKEYGRSKAIASKYLSKTSAFFVYADGGVFDAIDEQTRRQDFSKGRDLTDPFANDLREKLAELIDEQNALLNK